MWRKPLSHKSSIDLQKNINMACLYVREIRVSHCATELEWIWFLWIGISNLHYVKKETLFQTFSNKFCEFLHNDGFWDFMRIILQIFGWLLLDFLLLNRLFVNMIKIINLTILKVYPAELTRILFLMKSRFILSNYCAASKVSASLCIQSKCGKMRTVFTQCCAIKDAK